LQELEPIGEDRADLRFAVLAEVLVSALQAKKRDGNPFTAGDFIQRLAYEPAAEAKPVESQDAAVAERRLLAWISGSNAVWREEHGGE